VSDGLPDLAPDVPDPRVPEGGGPLRRWLHRRAWQPAVRRWTGIDEAVEAGFLARHVRPAAPLVVELGCGLGREARVLAGLLGPGRVVALDLSRAALLATRADSVGHGVAFVRADAARLPFVDASVGAVNTFGMLHHVPDPTAVVAEVGRVLAPGGTFTGQVAVSPLPGLGAWSAGGLARACRAAGLVPTVHEGGRGILMFAWCRPT
jgi:SAM-dependent methyltransferase